MKTLIARTVEWALGTRLIDEAEFPSKGSTELCRAIEAVM
jgi:hypothetical protein